MRLIVAVVVCLLAFVVTATFDPPNKGTTVYCYTLKCASESIESFREHDPVVIGLLSYSFAEDSYLALYLGSLLELFSMSEYYFIVVALESPRELQIMDVAYQFVQYLPAKSIFVSIEHGRSGTGIQTLQYLKQHGVAPKAVYHLNHEQPWQVQKGDFLNHIFDSVDQLAEFYRGFELVLRNYYYAPLTSSSYYLPVSAPWDGYILGNSSNELYMHARHITASQRSIMCHFKGRVDYAKYRQESGKGAAPTLLQSDEHFPQAIERREIIRLSQENKLGGCVASASAQSTLGAYEPNAGEIFMNSYNEYVQVLADAVFVLCPAGNNPETFRHIEVMEFGAIPVMLRPTDPSINFLNDVHWRGYPGPVLNNWAELEDFLHSVNTPEKLDALQAEVQAWYANFNLYKKQALLEQLVAVFEGTTKLDIVCTSCNADTVQIEGYAETVRIIQDLKFNEIPKGEYSSAIQALLVMVLKQEERIKQLEQFISQIVVVEE